MRRSISLILMGMLVLAMLLWQHHVPAPASVQLPDVAASSDQTNADMKPAGLQPATALPAFLPPEALTTLNAIASGGPFEHRQDGVVFGNYENLLPQQPRGYYHEYTVDTPGASTRGTRRIITGGTPPSVWYYTDDHYRSFRRFEANR